MRDGTVIAGDGEVLKGIEPGPASARDIELIWRNALWRLTHVWALLDRGTEQAWTQTVWMGTMLDALRSKLTGTPRADTPREWVLPWWDRRSTENVLSAAIATAHLALVTHGRPIPGHLTLRDEIHRLSESLDGEELSRLALTLIRADRVRGWKVEPGDRMPRGRWKTDALEVTAVLGSWTEGVINATGTFAGLHGSCANAREAMRQDGVLKETSRARRLMKRRLRRMDAYTRQTIAGLIEGTGLA